jgi:hypothetical protein
MKERIHAHPLPCAAFRIVSQTLFRFSSTSVPEAQDEVARSLQLSASCKVAVNGSVERMLATVELDDQPSIRAAKINDVAPNQHLPAKLPAAKQP